MRTVAVTALVLGLLVGTAAAFAMAEALKLERSPITAPRFTRFFSPTCACETFRARLSFMLRRADRLDAVVVGPENAEVRTLAVDRERARGRVTFLWDGRDDAGAVVPDGRYRLRVHLDRERRTILMPNTVTVDTMRPRARMVAVEPGVISPDGDGRADRAAVFYAASEPAGVYLFADGAFAHRRERLRDAGRARVWWNGAVPGVGVLDEGSYSLTMRVRDRAGNLSRETDALPAEIRFVRLVSAPARVRRGGRLRVRVDMDAASFTWQLRVRGARSRPVLAGAVSGRAATVTLPRRLRPGRYVLRVSVAGHHDVARIRVVRAR